MRLKYALPVLSVNFRAPVFLLLLFHLPVLISAQSTRSYSPSELHSARSKDLIDKLKLKHNEELSSFGAAANRTSVRQMCTFRNEFLVKQVKGKAFINDDTLTSFVEGIVRRIAAGNNLAGANRMVLILNSPDVNALCYGRGLYVVTVGLLGKMRSEDELAFIISHEMAHDQLRHVQENVMREVDTKWSNKTNEKIKKLLTDDATLEDLTSLRDWIYRASEFGRSKEYEADSVGFLFYKNAGYHPKSSITALNMIDSAKHPKYYSQNDFFSPLDSDKIPFKQAWLEERHSVYSRKPDSTSLFSIDSIQTHPPTEQRVMKLNTFIEDSTQNINHTPTVPLGYVVNTSEFQIVEAAYLANRYDQALYNILQLWTLYPHNDYLTSRATKILIDISEAKKVLATDRYASLSRYTGHYGEVQRHVNNLLYNISISEIGEVAFSLINNKSNFNSEQPAHYYLLWRVCSLTFRDKVKAQVETAYKEKFGKKIADYEYK